MTHHPQFQRVWSLDENSWILSTAASTFILRDGRQIALDSMRTVDFHLLNSSRALRITPLSIQLIDLTCVSILQSVPFSSSFAVSTVKFQRHQVTVMLVSADSTISLSTFDEQIRLCSTQTYPPTTSPLTLLGYLDRNPVVLAAESAPISASPIASISQIETAIAAQTRQPPAGKFSYRVLSTDVIGTVSTLCQISTEAPVISCHSITSTLDGHTFICIASADGRIALWDLESGAICFQHAYTSAVRCVASCSTTCDIFILCSPSSLSVLVRSATEPFQLIPIRFQPLSKIVGASLLPTHGDAIISILSQGALVHCSLMHILSRHHRWIHADLRVRSLQSACKLTHGTVLCAVADGAKCRLIALRNHQTLPVHHSPSSSSSEFSLDCRLTSIDDTVFIVHRESQILMDVFTFQLQSDSVALQPLHRFPLQFSCDVVPSQITAIHGFICDDSMIVFVALGGELLVIEWNEQHRRLEQLYSAPTILSIREIRAVPANEINGNLRILCHIILADMNRGLFRFSLVKSTNPLLYTVIQSATNRSINPLTLSASSNGLLIATRHELLRVDTATLSQSPILALPSPVVGFASSRAVLEDGTVLSSL